MGPPVPHLGTIEVNSISTLPVVDAELGNIGYLPRLGMREGAKTQVPDRDVRRTAGPVGRFAGARRKISKQRVCTTDAVAVASEIRCAGGPPTLLGAGNRLLGEDLS